MQANGRYNEKVLYGILDPSSEQNVGISYKDAAEALAKEEGYGVQDIAAFAARSREGSEAGQAERPVQGTGDRAVAPPDQGRAGSLALRSEGGVLEDPPQYVKDAIAGCLKDGLDKGFGNLLGTGLVIQQYPEEEILAEAIEMVMVGDKTDDDHYDLKKVDSMYKELMVSS